MKNKTFLNLSRSWGQLPQVFICTLLFVVHVAAIEAAEYSLSWNDNSSDEDGFVVERSIDGGDYVEIATLGENVTNYVDSDLIASTSYSYRVYAFNAAGDSEFSNVANETTGEGPTIGSVGDLLIAQDSSTGAIAVSVDDNETAAEDLVLTAISSNIALFPLSNITLGGSGADRTVNLTPESGHNGSATVTLEVDDGDFVSSTTFSVTVDGDLTNVKIVENTVVVTASGDDGNVPLNTLDGDTGTRWSFEGDGQWIQYDLGAVELVERLDMAFYVGDTRQTIFDVEISDDGSSWQNIFSGTSSGTTLDLETIDVTDTTGRYLRIIGHGNTINAWNSITEVDIFVDSLFVVENSAPTISNIADQLTNESESVGPISFEISDEESSSSSLVLTVESSNESLIPLSSIELSGTNSDRQLTISPAPNQSGQSTVTVRVSDGFETAESNFDLTVTANTPPTIDSIVNQVVNEDSSTGPISFAIGDGQSSSSVLQLTVSTSNEGLLPTERIVITGTSSDRQVDLDPVEGENGTATVTISVSDGLAATESTFDLIVIANEAPSISSIADQTIDEGQAIDSLPFVISDAETESSSLAVVITSSNQSLLPDSSIAVSGSGASRTIELSPVAGQSGDSDITVSVSDSKSTTSRIFKVTINEVSENQTPAISDVEDVSVALGAEVPLVGFTLSDAETSASDLVLELSTSNSDLIALSGIDILGVSGSRNFRLTPNEGAVGSSTITLVVSDGTKQTSESFELSISAAAKPTISGIRNLTANAGESIEDLLIVIEDLDTPQESLLFSIDSSNSDLIPEQAISIEGNGPSRTIQFGPLGNGSGASTIVITVADGQNSNSYPFTVTVVPVTSEANEAPFISGLISEIDLEVDETSDLIVFSIGDLENAEGDLLVTYQSSNETLLPVENIETGGFGSSRSFQVTPAAGLFGEASLSVTVSDGELDTTDSVLIRVSEAAPQVFRSVDEEGVLTLSTDTVGDSYQWYRGESGDTSDPVLGATNSSFVPEVDGRYWVLVTTAGIGGLSGSDLISESIHVHLLATGRAFFGSVGESEEGTIGYFEREDGTGSLMVDLPGNQPGAFIDEVELSESGQFSVQVEGMGTIAGTVSGTTLTGTVDGALSYDFSGIEAESANDTAEFAGMYKGVYANTSQREFVVVVAPDGSAQIASGLGEDYEIIEAIVDESGSVIGSFSDGSVVTLEIDVETSSFTGSVAVEGQPLSVGGRTENGEVEELLVNTSIRTVLKQGGSPFIAGFIIEGEGSKRVLIRGVGPTLRGMGLSNTIGDPRLTLYRQSDGAEIANNDNWHEAENSSELTSASQALGAFLLDENGKDAALLVDLPAGGYSAKLTVGDGTEGTAIIEIYDADDTLEEESKTNLLNISMRGDIGDINIGGSAVSAGFVVAGEVPKRVLIRAVGPELSKYGLSNVIADPVLRLHQISNGQSSVIVTNDDWSTDAEIVNEMTYRANAFPLDANSKSSAIVIWLDPGVYTAQAYSQNWDIGTALVEVYEVE